MADVPGVVLTLGETAVVLDPVADGDLEVGSTFRLRVSGAESNLAITLARLGVSTRWISRLGSDPLGQLVQRTVADQGVDTAGVVLDPLHPTAVTFKVRREGNASLIYIRRGSAASRMGPEDIADASLDGVACIHLTGITMALGPGPRAAVSSLSRRASGSGIPVTFDINHRPALWSAEDAADACREVLGHATWVLFGEDEGRALFGGDDLDSTIARVREAGARRMVCRVSARGAVVVDDDRTETVPAVPIGRIADDIGAGDAFDAGFVFGLVEGWPPEKGARLGTYLAARALSHTGEWEVSATRADVEAWFGRSRSSHRAGVGST